MSIAAIVLACGLAGLWGALLALWLLDRRTARREPGYTFVLKREG